ncbi:MAG: RelA/SpoT family protein [bacterium]|nr:RelA/SpoT family protein [bacterium]
MREHDAAIANYRERLLDAAMQTMSQEDVGAVEAAADYAIAAHDGQIRISGLPYVTHPLETARKLAAMQLPREVVIAGVLHDVYEDTNRTLEDIARVFGPQVAHLVSGVTKVGKVQLRGEQRYIENLRKMFVALAEDVRVMFIKFADRLHNLEDLEVVEPVKRHRIAMEALEIYAPIANRFGMMSIKAQLEDLAFPFAHPEDAAWVQSLVAETVQERSALCIQMTEELRRILTIKNIAFESLSSRMKHRYSVYQKLLQHDRDITQIYDLTALRIVVHDIADCYAVLGAIHQRWKPLKGRIKDYIANPKPNGYQSIHTTIVADAGGCVELQIRTPQMHEEAEWGAAAAWRYHERGSYRPPERQLRWVHDLIEWQRSIKDPQDFLAGLKTEVLRDRILVFTPRGDVIDLPEGATPLDFAYQIHTGIGHRAIGARVNGKQALQPLDKPLQSGDLVEIITDPKRKGPSPDWLYIVRTTYARAKIKEALRAQLRNQTSSWDAAKHA